MSQSLKLLRDFLQVQTEQQRMSSKASREEKFAPDNGRASPSPVLSFHPIFINCLLISTISWEGDKAGAADSVAGRKQNACLVG